jgi:hypothetical protein
MKPLVAIGLVAVMWDAGRAKEPTDAPAPVAALRVAVANGLVRNGPWPALATEFQKTAPMVTVAGQRD